MGKQKKSTKRFEKNELKTAINHRKKKQTYEKGKKRDREGDDEMHEDAKRAKVLKEKAVKQSQAAAHKQELEELKESQKEFFEYLQSETPELLDFDANDDLSDHSEEENEDGSDSDEDAERAAMREAGLLDDDDAMEVDEAEGKTKQKKGKKGKAEEDYILTKMLFSRWRAAAVNDASLAATQKLVKAFQVAAHVNDAEEDVKNSFKYKILDGQVFNDVIMFAVRELGAVFDTHLNRPEITEEEEKNQARANFLPNKFPRWRKVKLLVKTYLSNLIHFANTLTEPKMLTFLLQSTQNAIHYFGPFPGLSKLFLRFLLDKWGSGEEAVRIVAFLNIREMALRLPYPFINGCLKGLYLTYVRNAKFANSQTAGLLMFMENCVIELYGLDFGASYQHAFVYIRQLAVHLRIAYSKHKSKEAHASVYNWQTIHSIRVWARVLAAYPRQEKLWLLAFPLIQLVHGVISLVPTARHFPLRLHCVSYLLLLAEKSATNTELPIMLNSVSTLLEILEYPAFFKKPPPYSGKPPSFAYTLRVSDKMLNSRVFQKMVMLEAHHLLAQYFCIYSRSIAFPELVLPATVAMKRFLKKSRVPLFSNKIRGLLDVMNRSSQYVAAKRNMVTFGPADHKKVATFLKADSGAKGVKAPTPLEKYFAELREAKHHIDKMALKSAQQTHEASGSDDDESDSQSSMSVDGSSADEEAEEVPLQESSEEESEEDEDFEDKGDAIKAFSFDNFA